MSTLFLHMYDMSSGLAKQFSPLLLGKTIDGIWHTGVVVYNREYFFGKAGIQYCQPSGTVLGEPLNRLPMGETSLTESEFIDYLQKLAVTAFRPGTYDLFHYNCNTFSAHLINDLTNKKIPSYITDLPQDILSTPIGSLLKPAIDRLSANVEGSSCSPVSLGTDNRSTNNHSFQYAQERFGPILFNEPLPENVANRITLLWNAASSTHFEPASLLTKFAAGSGDEEQLLDHSVYSLLRLSDMCTPDQVIAVCELFRLAIWRSQTFLTALLTDLEGNLQNVCECELPPCDSSEMLEMQAARAKMLCNCLGLTHDATHLSHDMIWQMKSIVHICLSLLGHDEHRIQRCDDEDFMLLSEHRQIGLALAHNAALHSMFEEEEALELGTYLLHMAIERKRAKMQSLEVIYLLRTIYFLTIRFSVLADLARCYNLEGTLGLLSLEACDSPSHDETHHTSGVTTLKLQPQMTSVTLDDLISSLLDLLRIGNHDENCSSDRPSAALPLS